jgi:hypothetical protein
MDAPDDDRFFAELRACTAELARIIEGDLVAPGAWRRNGVLARLRCPARARYARPC